MLLFLGQQTNERLDTIEQRLSLLELTDMALPEVIQTALAVEIEEAMKLQESIKTLNAEIARLEAIQASTPTPQVGEAIVNLQELSTAISSIVAAPVASAVVEEVIENPSIDTPAVVEAAPEILPETVPTAEVVEAAMEALV
jgi:hypothetical protein